MNRFLKYLFRERRREFILILVLLWIIPLLGLAALGLWLLWLEDMFWWFSGSLLALSLVTLTVRYFIRRNEEAVDDTDVEHLDPRPDWSAHDNDVWRKSLKQVENSELALVDWDQIPSAMLEHLFFVARAYHGDKDDVKYAFTVPELLLMLEIWSKEYRENVVDSVPLVQDVKISTVIDLSRKLDTAKAMYKYAGPVVRLLRLAANPATGVVREAGSILSAQALGGLSDNALRNMKVILFEQVTRVGIDLYSGRLKISQDELAQYRKSVVVPEDDSLKPLTILIGGQLNAGKSSLINALRKRCLAETDLLPATSGFSFYCMQLTEELDINLVDSPGLDGSPTTSNSLLEEAGKADLLLWVSQATQPAKALDKAFLELFDEFFAQNIQRRRPAILLVTTHNDMLPPSGKWSPPYDLSNAQDKKACSILQALNYTHESLGLSEADPMLPIAMPPDRQEFNIHILQQLIIDMSDQARAAQLNRQRLEAFEGRAVVSSALRKSAGLVKFAKALVRKKSDH